MIWVSVASVTVFAGGGPQSGGGALLGLHVFGAPTLSAPYEYRFQPGGRVAADVRDLTEAGGEVVVLGTALLWCEPLLHAAAAVATNATATTRKGPLTRSTTLRP